MAHDINTILKGMSIEKKLDLLKGLMLQEKKSPEAPIEKIAAVVSKTTVDERGANLKDTIENSAGSDTKDRDNDEELSLLSFAKGKGRGEGEIKDFNSLRDDLMEQGLYSIETMRLHATKPSVEIKRQTGEKFRVLNFANYNYLGYATHPKVIQAAKDSLDKYGLGATASPITAGMLDLHKEFEDHLIKHFGLEGYGITLFSSGYGSLSGTISAYMHETDHVILDSNAHACIIEGAQLSNGTIHQFYHNDMEELEDILKDIDDAKNRILICTEGVYSADGDYGDLKNIVALAKKYGAKTLVDEAHSMLVTGTNGRGACDEFGVLGEVDMVVGTFSKGFSGIGGFLFAKKDLTNYVNFFARNRMFSCALDPAVTGGMLASLKLASSADGNRRRKRLREKADYFRSLLKGKVDIGKSTTWVIPVIYGADDLTLPIADFLQKNGFEGSMMSYPAVPRNKARIRVFMSSEHSKKEIEKGAKIILKAAEYFNFLV